MTMIAVHFALRSMLPSRCQLSIKGPKARCSRNQLFSRSEDRANAKAATNRNGVVGNKGSTTPTAPIATAARPANNQKNRVFALTLAVHHTTIGSRKSGSTICLRVEGLLWVSSSLQVVHHSTGCFRALTSPSPVGKIQPTFANRRRGTSASQLSLSCGQTRHRYSRS